MGSYNQPTQQQKPWIETPLIESRALSKAAGCKLLLKLENLQPSGSFKSRGVGNLVLQNARKHAKTDPDKSLHFYASSGGNAGLACVTAATSLGYPASIVVPTSTKPMMVAKLKAAGAQEVVQTGASWQFADQYLREEVLGKLPQGKVTGVYVPPFDHELIFEGNATLVHELKNQMPYDERPDAVICSVGGGGLISGVCLGLDQVGWGDVPVLAMETMGAESLAKSLQADERVTLDGITSIATSLGAVRVAEQTFRCGQRANVKSVVLRDAEAAMGSWRLADDERVLVDPACGVSVAPCYDGRLKQLLPGLNEESKVVVVVCGGSQVTVEMVAEWRRTYAQEAERIGSTTQAAVPSSHTMPAA